MIMNTVRDVMTAQVVTVTPSSSWKDAVRLVEQAHVHALPVVEDGRLVGIVAESDLLLKEEMLTGPLTLRAMPLQRRRDKMRARATTVGQMMSSPVVTIEPDALLGTAARLLHRRHIGRLPVLDARGELVGIVTRSDLLRVFLREDAEILEEVREVLATPAPRIGNGLTATVEDGVVTLHGDVERLSQALAALSEIRKIGGVVAIEDRSMARVDDVNIAMVGP
jgi:CBS-domain-containing membrane protein